MRILPAALLVAIPAFASAQAKPYVDGYADAYWSKLTGFSTFQVVRAGFKMQQHDFHVYARNDTYDTRGTELPFQYAGRGTTVGVGYRFWVPGNKWFFNAMMGVGLDKVNQSKSDLRVGIAGFDEWRREGRGIVDLYAELFYVDRAKDTFFSARVRPGLVLQQRDDGRTWFYFVGQVYASGKGASGSENRIEGGVGAGYTFANHFTINAEARQGYSFRGLIKDKNYFNPVVYIAASF